MREEIQEGLDQLLREADQLRKALAALEPRSSAPTSTSAARKRAEGPPPQPDAPTAKGEPARRSRQPAATSRRTAPGATKTAVLEALAGGEALTAGQIAERTGLPRATV